MDDEQLNALCDELRGLARLSPGINPPSTLRVRAIAEEIQRSVDSKGTNVRAYVIDLLDGFQLWFSQRKWNQSGDEGRHAKFNVIASILKLEVAVGDIHRSRIKTTRARKR